MNFVETICESLVSNKKKRLKTVIKAKSDATKYLLACKNASNLKSVQYIYKIMHIFKPCYEVL